MVVAHPDDIDFGMAGTVATLTAAGTEVVYCLATSGEAGGPDHLDRAELKAIREEEQRAAAAEVGVTDVRFLGQPDGHVEFNLGLRRDISRVIRDVKCDLVLCHSSDRVWDSVYFSHPDHLAVGAAAACAVYPDARNPHAHVELLNEGYLPHAVERMWVVGLESNVFIDVTDVFDARLRALRSHKSQISERNDLDQMLHNRAAETARLGGLPEGRLAEAFREIDAR